MKDQPADEEKFGELMKVYLDASMAVWNDPAVWLEELGDDVFAALPSERHRAREGKKILAWPLPQDQGTLHQKFLAVLFNSEVEMVLTLLKVEGHPASPEWPPQVDDPRFQRVLRVMHRALRDGEAAMVHRFGDGQIVSGRRIHKNRIRDGLVQLAKQSGLFKELEKRLGDVNAAFAALGTSRSAGYRGMGNKQKRR